MTEPGARAGVAPLVLAALVATGLSCDRAMTDQARVEPYEASVLFPDGTSARPIPAGTVAREWGDEERGLGLGGEPGERSLARPFDRELVHRGRERYDVFCSPCHDRTGSGDGMIVQRGYPRPPSFHLPRLRAASDEHFHHAVTNGFGRMPSYADAVAPRDRWAIASWIRVLQLSQHAPSALLQEQDLERAREAAP